MDDPTEIDLNCPCPPILAPDEPVFNALRRAERYPLRRGQYSVVLYLRLGPTRDRRPCQVEFTFLYSGGVRYPQ